MRITKNTTKLLAVLTAVTSLMGCAGPSIMPELGAASPAASNATAENRRSEMVATDLVSAMMQLSEFPPWATTLQLSEPGTPFGQALVDAFMASGFGVQQVVADSGLNNVAHARTVITTEKGDKFRYSIAIRDFEIYRDFTVNNGLIFPDSPFYISGANAQNVMPNDDLYRQQGGVGANGLEFPSGVKFVNADGSFSEYNKRLVKVNPGSKRSEGESISNERILISARSRVLFTTKINTSVDVKLWPAYKQVILNFPSSDTSILGNNNKQAIAQIIGEFDSVQHGLSIAGCAADKSLLWDGTELDSLDRQRRVFDELLVSGIPVELITENGCFGSQFNDLIPQQGVVLTMRLRVQET